MKGKESFHEIIGYRYSPDRTDRSKIAQADFPAGFVRVKQPTVQVVQNPLDYPPVDPENNYYVVDFPYKSEEPPAIAPVYPQYIVGYGADGPSNT